MEKSVMGTEFYFYSSYDDQDYSSYIGSFIIYWISMIIIYTMRYSSILVNLSG